VFLGPYEGHCLQVCPVHTVTSCRGCLQLEETAKSLQEAQEMSSITIDTMKMLESAAASATSVAEENKAKSPRVAELEAKIVDAMKAARDCLDDCGVKWDEVEELSEAVDRLKNA